MPTPEQMEFDLVSPLLSDAPGVPALLAQADDSARMAQQKLEAARLATRLHHEDLVYGRVTDELEQVRVIVGREAWRRTHKIWERRARTNPRRVRKFLIAAKSFFRI